MTTLSWNCRGLSSNLTVRRIEEMCHEHLPDFLFLLETKNSSDHVEAVTRSLGYDHKFLVNPVGLSGGLALFWKQSFQVEVLSSSNRMIDTKVKAGNIDCFMTFVYGDPVRQRRHEVWNVLKTIGLSRNGGWGLISDFNEIMNGHEKLSGPDSIESSFYQFRSMARSCRIKEIPSSGERLSWAGVREVITNGVKENVWIQCRLDRAFGNAEWFRIFPRSHVRYLERLGSDHRPIFMSMSAQTQQRRGRFIFDKRWSSQPAVNEIIKKQWKPVVRPEGHDVSSVISSCRKKLAKWKRSDQGNSRKQINKLRRELEEEETKHFPILARITGLSFNLLNYTRKKRRSGNKSARTSGWWLVI